MIRLDRLIQCHRALKPDGLLLVVCLGGETLHELRAALGQAEIEVTGGLSPAYRHLWESFAISEGLLQRAGSGASGCGCGVPVTAEYQDIWHLMRDLRNMGETNALTARLKHPTRRAVFDKAQRLYADHFTAPSGRLNATFELICLTGWAPDDSQPKPLRPGSAQMRLADALHTKEGKLPD